MSIDSLQKSCELVAQLADLKDKQIQLNLDLQFAQENVQKAKDEAKGMAGEDSTAVSVLLPVLNSVLIVALQTNWRRP